MLDIKDFQTLTQSAGTLSVLLGLQREQNAVPTIWLTAGSWYTSDNHGTFA